MLRIAYALVAGLIGAGIVHIAVLLLLPDFSERDAWARLEAQAGLYSVLRINGSPAGGVLRRSSDPLMLVNACRFSLEDGFAHIKAPGQVPFWSVSIYDRGGQNIYSFNDRANQGGELDIVVLTPAQMIDIRKVLPEDLVTSVFVEADVREGIVLVRAFVPDETWAPRVDAYLATMSCRQE
jgi:uncharacterized membrane protein